MILRPFTTMHVLNLRFEQALKIVPKPPKSLIALFRSQGSWIMAMRVYIAAVLLARIAKAPLL